MLMPQTPTPLTKSHVAPSIRHCSRLKEIRKPKIHPSVVLRLRTMPPILSETDARLWPGSITGPISIFDGSSTGWSILAFLLSSRNLRIGVAYFRQIGIARTSVQLAQQRIIQLFLFPPHDS